LDNKPKSAGNFKVFFYECIQPKKEDLIKKYIEIVGQSPLIFSVSDFAPKYRHVVIFGSYVMFYAVDETNKTVFIYRILVTTHELSAPYLQKQKRVSQ
jgi:mRNA-degrading endonuclease RelE of RelBE toxin-antitoxin system